MRRASYYSQVLGILQALHRAYPNYNIGKHLSTALDGYGDMWGITDREMLFALEKYKAQLEMDIPHADDDEIDQIIKEGMNLDDILKDQDGEDY
jgi:putative lipase involved disintegration of autophagic bodies